MLLAGIGVGGHRHETNLSVVSVLLAADNVGASNVSRCLELDSLLCHGYSLPVSPTVLKYQQIRANS